MAAKHQQPQFQPAIIITFLLFSIAETSTSTSTSTRQTIDKGFTVVHDPSYTEFQPLLADPTGVFSLGFLRVNSTLLDLAVIHLPSSFPLWRAVVAAPAVASWSAPTTFLTFNGTLLLFDNSSSQQQLLWSTHNDDAGDRLLLNSSNLQIQKQQSVLWQSFDFPSDTLVQSQNFTTSAALLSQNHNFSMRMGSNYVALYMERELELTQSSTTSRPIMYWKHTAMESKAQIVDGGGEIYACVQDDGFLGMYQSSQTVPVDLISFNSFNRGISGFRRLTLETDGNLRAYYWNGTSWLLDFVAITEPCGLPTVCGAYGLCSITSSGEQRCGCLLASNNTSTSTSSSEDEQQGQCLSAGAARNDLCVQGEGNYQVVRRQGVDLSINKELVSYQKLASMADCETSCENNCTCWGAIYNNNTGFCYQIDFPIQTLVEADDRKLAYLKVLISTTSSSSKNSKGGHREKLVLLVLAIGLLVVGAAYGVYRVWQWWQRRDDEDVDQSTSLPYKNLSSASFRSIELTNTTNK